MTASADSTLAPSRRAFFAHAALSGLAATQPPIFTVPAVADAAILALGPVIVGLIATAEYAHKNHTAAEELVFEMTGPVPTKPRDATFFHRFADYQAAMARFQADMEDHQTRTAQVEERTGYAGLEAAADAAETAVVDACADLAEMRATTLPGLILKARLAERGNWDELSRSIVADLLAMA